MVVAVRDLVAQVSLLCDLRSENPIRHRPGGVTFVAISPIRGDVVRLGLVFAQRCRQMTTSVITHPLDLAETLAP